MPGTITFRPIEANLTHNTDLIGKMNPYCAFIVGDSIFRGQICKKGGKHPHWEDTITIPYTNQNQVIVEVMDKDRFSRDDNIGSFMINLNEVQQTGQSSRWYPLTYKNKPAGEILLETCFSGESGLGANRNLSGGSQGFVGGAGPTQYSQTQTQQTGYVQRGNSQSQLNQGFIEGQTISQPGYVEEEVITTTTTKPAIVEQEIIREQVQVPVQERHIFQEQQQIIEPRTFLKEVDVVETRSHLETIEVLEPQKVMKEVQYTQAVPVTKQIEVIEPHVVLKEVEVIEPRLVTKTIQVIENVPVKKQVEVIESVPRMQDYQTFEAQTFTKQVEVTDYVPVSKQVTVSEPVHLKKSVEFVEPVITTKTITKEIMAPVIVDEKITTSIGPASVVGESTTYVDRFSQMTLTQEQRTFRQREWERLYNQGVNEQQIEQQLGYSRRGLFSPTHKLFRRNSFTGLNNTQIQEYERLRGTGLCDYEIEKQLGTSGTGIFGQGQNLTTSTYTTGQNLGSGQSNYNQGQKLAQPGYSQGQNLAQSGFSHLSQEQKQLRQQEYNRLKSTGLSEKQIESQLEGQGLGAGKLTQAENYLKNKL